MSITTPTMVCFHIVLIVIYASIATSNSQPFKKIYAFGDSYTDTGNTKHVSNPPYGNTYFHHPTNRFSDGRLVIDFVAEALRLPYLTPYVKVRNKTSVPSGVNFAVGGSTAINHDYFVRNNLTLDATPQSIQTQLGWFNSFMESQGCGEAESSSPQCKAMMSDALFWVGEMGVNDYAYTIGSSVTPDSIRQLAIHSLTAFLQALLKKGAKHVAVQGLPPTGCLPLTFYLYPQNDRDKIGCVKTVNDLSYLHNTVYLSRIQDLRKQFPDATITYIDFWNAYHTVMKNPDKYGFTEPVKACCGSGQSPYHFDPFATCGTPTATACTNPEQYINWDGFHLTEAMYKVLYSLFVNGGFSQPPLGNLLKA